MSQRDIMETNQNESQCFNMAPLCTPFQYNTVEAALNLTQLNNGTVSTKVDNNAKAIELLLSSSGLSLPTAHSLFEKVRVIL